MKKKFINIAIQLPDKRVLTYKEILLTGQETRWGITIGRTIVNDALIDFGGIMRELFRLDVAKYNDDFADMKRLAPINLPGDAVTIVPFVVKLKKAFIFKTRTNKLFRAVEWENILKEIMQDTIYHSANAEPTHTPMAVEAAKELHIRGAFDE